MMRPFAISMLCCVLLLTPVAGAWAAPSYTYWPGFTGRVVSMMWPADVSKASDRSLTLVVRIAKDPKARPVAYDSAFHAICQRHRTDLLRAARKLSPDTDWRVKVRITWPVAQTDGVGVALFRNKALLLSNCRPA